MPAACPDVPTTVLDPRTAWQDKGAYDLTARELRGRFVDNFKQFEDFVDDRVRPPACAPPPTNGDSRSPLTTGVGLIASAGFCRAC